MSVISALAGSLSSISSSTTYQFTSADWNWIAWGGDEIYGFGTTNTGLVAIPVGATVYVNGDMSTPYTVTYNTTVNPAGYIHIGVVHGGPGWQGISSITAVY